MTGGDKRTKYFSEIEKKKLRVFDRILMGRVSGRREIYVYVAFDTRARVRTRVIRDRAKRLRVDENDSKIRSCRFRLHASPLFPSPSQRRGAVYRNETTKKRTLENGLGTRL